MKLTYDDIIEVKEVDTQLSFGRYKGKFVLRYYSSSVYKKISLCSRLDKCEISFIMTIDYKIILVI